MVSVSEFDKAQAPFVAFTKNSLGIPLNGEDIKALEPLAKTAQENTLGRIGNIPLGTTPQGRQVTAGEAGAEALAQSKPFGIDIIPDEIANEFLLTGEPGIRQAQSLYTNAPIERRQNVRKEFETILAKSGIDPRSGLGAEILTQAEEAAKKKDDDDVKKELETTNPFGDSADKTEGALAERAKFVTGKITPDTLSGMRTEDISSLTEEELRARLLAEKRARKPWKPSGGRQNR